MHWKKKNYFSFSQQIFFFFFFSRLNSFFWKHVIKAIPYMFNTWHRYVYVDIFASIPVWHIQNALTLLNIQENSIRITLKTETNGQLPFDVITSIKSMESMCMYEKVFSYLTAYPVTLLRFTIPYVTFCGIHKNIM